ncbi:MAG: choice-of-anchor D domain-containing protein, partial [Mycobacterium sp.]
MEEPAVCATNSCPIVTYSQSGSYPDGIAIDGAENLFTNDGIGSALELPAVGVVTTLATDLASPALERVDAADDLFIADYFNNRFLEVPFGCTTNDCQMSVGSGIQAPFGVALDGAGDLYISSGGNNQVYEVQRSQPPSLSFPSTAVSATSSPLTVAIQNIGNQPLTFFNFVASTSFVVDSATTTCSTSSPLGVGAACNVGVDFAPETPGTLTGTLTLTDNALNASSATQTVNLSGTASAPCAAGTYSSTGNTPCIPAPAGSYVSGPGATSATLCSAGSYQPSTGQTSCIASPAGSYVGAPGATAATQCSAGSYQPNTGQTSCLASPAGSAVAGPGATAATPCTAGSYQPNTGQTSCIASPAGSAVAGPGATAATPCTAGSYQPNTGQTSCIASPAGSYVSGPGATAATQCSAGSYQPNSGQIACLASPAGSYVSGPGATAATQCNAGYYQPNTGQTSCIPSPAGSYVPGGGATGSMLCTAGSYQPNTGQASCILAGIGYYVPNPGQTFEDQCPSGETTTAPGATACVPDALTASPSSFAFPNLAPLESYAKLILVENISATKFTVGTATITATGGDAHAFTIHQFCEPATLKPQHSCYIGVTFMPHQLGLSTATMNIPFTGTGSPLEVPLTGTGIPRAGKVTASPTSFNFGNVTVGTYS